jgi:hypothetical protein
VDPTHLTNNFVGALDYSKLAAALTSAPAHTMDYEKLGSALASHAVASKLATLLALEIKTNVAEAFALVAPIMGSKAAMPAAKAIMTSPPPLLEAGLEIVDVSAVEIHPQHI